jgi:hypothetical protein
VTSSDFYALEDLLERAEFPHLPIPGIAGLGIADGTVEGYGSPGMSAVAAGVSRQCAGPGWCAGSTARRRSGPT